MLAVDVGNSAIKFGLFEGEGLVRKISIPTDRAYSPQDIAARITEDFGPVDRAIACSVVPELDDAVRGYVRQKLGIDVEFFTADHDLGLKVDYETVSTLGTDRLVNAFAAARKYGTPCIVCSLGTATTIDAVDAEWTFLGGVIAPGMKTMARALHLAASRLPEVEIARPGTVIAKSTEECIRSGVFYGYAGLVDGLVERIAATLAWNAKVVATGGFAAAIAADCPAIQTVDEDLTLTGLRLIAARPHPDPQFHPPGPEILKS